jgi:hypothetical protein
MQAKIASTLILLFLFTFCGCSSNVNKVKEFSPSQYPSITLEKLFNNHFEFEKTNWEEKSTDRGEKYVQFTGYYKPSNLLRDKMFIAQFTFNNDNKNIGFHAAGVKIRPVDDDAKYLLMGQGKPDQIIEMTEAFTKMYNKQNILDSDIPTKGLSTETELATKALFGNISNLNPNGAKYCLKLLKGANFPKEYFSEMVNFNMKAISSSNFDLEDFIINNIQRINKGEIKGKVQDVIDICNQVVEAFPVYHWFNAKSLEEFNKSFYYQALDFETGGRRPLEVYTAPGDKGKIEQIFNNYLKLHPNT